jgi:hypothetical protein
MAQRESQSDTTIDHDEIRRWAEERDGAPATVKGTGKKNDAGILRLDFEPKDQELEEISWDEFFDKFEQEGLAFLYQEQTAEGKVSRFHKFVPARSGPEGIEPVQIFRCGKTGSLVKAWIRRRAKDRREAGRDGIQILPSGAERTEKARKLEKKLSPEAAFPCPSRQDGHCRGGRSLKYRMPESSTRLMPLAAMIARSPRVTPYRHHKARPVPSTRIIFSDRSSAWPVFQLLWS